MREDARDYLFRFFRYYRWVWKEGGLYCRECGEKKDHGCACWCPAQKTADYITMLERQNEKKTEN